MATTQNSPQGRFERTTKTVLDLSTFENVTLIRNVTLPERPTTLNEAMTLVQNNTERLMDLIDKGLRDEAIEQARSQPDGWFKSEGNQKFGESYQGNFADDDKTDNINLMILNLAKAGGYNQDLTKEQKKAIKDQAKAFIRANPAMIQFIAGAPKGVTPVSDEAKKELAADKDEE